MFKINALIVGIIFSLVVVILGLQGIVTVHDKGVLVAATMSNINNSNNITNSNSNNTQNNNNILLTKVLAKNLENHLQKAGAIIKITSKLPQVRNVSYAHLLNQTLNTLHGIPQQADIQKRQVAKAMLSSNSDFQIVIFIMPNGDIYFDEPYSRQQISTTTNLAFRDYFKGVIRTNDIYLGDPTPSASSGQMQSIIAIPVYSLKDNSTVAGVWAGGIDFNILNKELQSLNISSLSDNGNNTRVVYAGHNGQKIADSDINKSKTAESFATLNSFKNAINGKSGSIIDTVDNKKMLVMYQPVKAFHNTWVVLLMQPIPTQ
ncbi:MAG TPA: cache domain-containing protein [Nitrososphaeraceae archaeon]